MRQKSHESTSEIEVDNIKRISHWVFSIAPFLGATLGFILRKNHYILEFIVMGTAIVANFLIFWRSSKTEERRALQLFLAFITNRLPPPNQPGELTSHTDVAILEARKKPYFRKALWEKFQTKPAKEGSSRIPDIDERLSFTLIECDSLERKNADSEEAINTHVALEKAKKRELLEDMTRAKAEAVVVMRSRHLEQSDWVYECVNDWAQKNPEVPVLFVRPKRRTKHKANEIEGNFFWIPNDPKSLPWRLLKRAKDRADDWYVQARYNSALLTNILFLLLMIMSIGGFLVGTRISDLEADIVDQETKLKNDFDKEKTKLERTFADQRMEYDTITKNNFGGSEVVFDLGGQPKAAI